MTDDASLGTQREVAPQTRAIWQRAELRDRRRAAVVQLILTGVVLLVVLWLKGAIG